MRFWASIAAIVVVVIGVVWTLQGVNVLGGSFMSGDRTWFVIGIAIVIASVAVLAWMWFRAAR